MQGCTLMSSGRRGPLQTVQLCLPFCACQQAWAVAWRQGALVKGADGATVQQSCRVTRRLPLAVVANVPWHLHSPAAQLTALLSLCHSSALLPASRPLICTSPLHTLVLMQ